MPFAPDDTFGPYKLVAPLGEGGMGVVWTARDIRLGRTVALKVAKSDFSERFEREARAVAALNHPNICTLHDVGPNYLVMELVEGAPLKGPLPVAKAVELAGQILDALDAAHRKGITHRDLKPANIMVSRQGIKLLDFGLAKRASVVSDSDMTATSALTGQGQIVGTLQYMSPEQLQGTDADPRSDIFAFGCVFYEMLSGKQAFAGASAASVIAAILHRDPAPLDVTPSLGRLIHKCLAKDPEERFQNARDLKYNLTLAMEASQSGSGRVQSRPWPWMIAASLAAAAAIIIGAVHLLSVPAPAPLTTFTIFPEEKTAMTGLVAVSPDGRSIVFSARDSTGRQQLWSRTLDSAETKRLPGTEGGTGPGWSPDGRWVAFQGDGKLKRIEMATHRVFAIADVGGNARGLSWAPDGSILFANQGYPIRRVPVTGGLPQAVTTLDRSGLEVGHAWPSLLPDGKRFLFLARSSRSGAQGIWVSSLDRPTDRKRILDDISGAAYASGHLLFVRDGALMAQPFDPGAVTLTGAAEVVAPKIGFAPSNGNAAFGVSPGGTLVWSPSLSVTAKARLTWFDRSGNRLEDVGPVKNYSSVSISPDGSRIAASHLDVTTNLPLLVLDLARGGATEIGRQDTIYAYPIWSSDGTRVAYGVTRGGPLQLAALNSSGVGAEDSLIENGMAKTPYDWSSDGRSLLYGETGENGITSLWMLGLNSGAKPERLLPADFESRYGQISPDVRWLAYSATESPVQQVYVQSFPPGRGKWQISNDGGSQPRWRGDGKELFYLDPLGKMMSVEIKGGSDFVPGPPKQLFAFRGSSNLSPTFRYDVTSDGKKFLILTPVEDTTFDPLHVVMNWTAGRRK